MKAMIFAAGMGTRLKPITNSIPKAMVKVDGKPLIEHVITKLKDSGFNEIIINVHHFGDQIINFLKEKNNFDIKIEVSDERAMLLDTGGGIKKAAHFFDDNKPFLVHNVDILSNIDLQKLYLEHTKHQDSLATLLVSQRDSSRQLLFDNNMRMWGWRSEKTGATRSPLENFNADNYTALAFSGIHIMSPKIFDFMESWPEKFSIIDFYLKIAAEGEIYGHEAKGLRFMDVGKIETLGEASHFLKTICR